MDLQPVTPKLERLFHAVVEIGAPISVGMTPLGERRIIPITGGHFEGEQLAGEVLPGGADWQLVRAAEQTATRSFSHAYEAAPVSKVGVVRK